MGDGRSLGFAEFGPPRGRPFMWLHGTPGARRQIPEAARLAAAELDVRIIGIDRPGVGLSTPHLYDHIVDFVPDLATVADQLGIGRFGLIGLSGGGPYALACAAGLGSRVAVVGILGGVAPTRGPDAVPGGAVRLALPFAGVLPVLSVPLAGFVSSLVRVLRPFASPGFELYARFSPEGDRRVFARPEIKAMFLDDLVGNSRRGLRAPVYDVILFTRPWGFSLADVRTPVHWWHGDADHMVPLAHGRAMVDRLPDAVLSVQAGESHLGGLTAAEEVLSALCRQWSP